MVCSVMGSCGVCGCVYGTSSGSAVGGPPFMIIVCMALEFTKSRISLWGVMIILWCGGYAYLVMSVRVFMNLVFVYYIVHGGDVVMILLMICVH